MRLIKDDVVVLLGVMFTVMLGGCVSSPQSPYTDDGEISRNPQRAEELTQEALDIIGEDPIKAETLLRDALAEDLYHGPAHNNLGVLLLQRGDLYAAAHEFEWSRKLLPGHPDPRLNLGLVMERAGRVDEALASYEAALEAYPGHIPSTAALVRLCLRYSIDHEQLDEMLRTISLGSDPHWSAWARTQSVNQDSR